MAINCYCGLQGSGKSYEVVSSVIIPAISNGRRVVTNIDGIDQEKIHQFILRSDKKAVLSKLGSIVLITNDRILESAFFPDEASPDIESVVSSGDLVCIDEAWRFWSSDGGRLSHEHMQFFRMHRHYTHPETGVACDVALIIQDISGLHRSVKNVVESSFRMTKLKSLGLNSRYRVEVFEGAKQLKRQRTALFQRKYDKDIFPLYQSYDSVNATETAIDERQNVFKSTKVWVLMALILFFMVGGSYTVLSFFNPRATEINNNYPTPDRTALDPLEKRSNDLSQQRQPSLSADWRIVGSTHFEGSVFVVLSNARGQLRLESASGFLFSGPLAIGTVDGVRVTTYSGRGGLGEVLK